MKQFGFTADTVPVFVRGVLSMQNMKYSKDYTAWMANAESLGALLEAKIHLSEIVPSGFSSDEDDDEDEEPAEETEASPEEVLQYHLVQKCSGVFWVKDEVSRWIPSPEPKEQQDVWEDPVLLSCDRGILLVCPASKSLWWMPQMDGEWIPIPMDNWCAQGIPKPVAVTGSQGVFPIVCRVDNSADATNSFTSLTVDFETMTAHWAESGSCV